MGRKEEGEREARTEKKRRQIEVEGNQGRTRPI